MSLQMEWFVLIEFDEQNGLLVVACHLHTLRVEAARI